jgi:hypothetical protein
VRSGCAVLDRAGEKLKCGTFTNEAPVVLFRTMPAGGRGFTRQYRSGTRGAKRSASPGTARDEIQAPSRSSQRTTDDGSWGGRRGCTETSPAPLGGARNRDPSPIQSKRVRMLNADSRFSISSKVRS